ncbi:MAG: malto-oligosyltrehalose synthase [Candidatus Omnitrophota bacterium]
MKIPISTYRLQFNPAFTFADAKKNLSYLKSLGISDIYASPIFKSRKGSMHGYDIVDPNQLNPELGSTEDFNALTEDVKNRQMGWVQDIVPNHMAFDRENEMLMDVLEMGKLSPYYKYFDIDWNHPYESMRGRLLAPFLGKFYAECLEAGEIKLQYSEKGLSINYYSLQFPLKIESYKMVCLFNIDELKLTLGQSHPLFLKYLNICSVFDVDDNLPEMEKYNQLRQGKDLLRELYVNDELIKNFIDGNIKAFNGTPADVESFNLLEDILSRQLFRLSFWKVATEEINYRRFFNINELICLRIEDDDVYRRTHVLLGRLFDEGKISGIRVDHIDGLYDPGTYLEKLKKQFPDSYLLVEKILISQEKLPGCWPVQGTTGYDFLNYVNGLFCLKRNQRKINRIYSKFTSNNIAYDELAGNKKRLIIGKHMAGNIDNLAHFMKKISSYSRYGSDITLYGLRRALVEVLTNFPVYRTYISRDNFKDTDVQYVLSAIKKAKQSIPGLVYELDFIEKFLLLKPEHYIREQERGEVTDFVMQFQQVSGPLMAKGVEDTVCYVYNRLLSLNEVGASPDKFGIFSSDFHYFSKRKKKKWPYSLNSLSTHDTKRGEDVRARINVLSEIPAVWEQNIKHWHRLNKKFKTSVNGMLAPDKNDEYFLYQTLIGAFPFFEKQYPRFLDRVKEYIIKAVREAKVHTAWLKPDIDYENAYISFAEELLKFSPASVFMNEFLSFQKKVAHYGIFNSLAQALIKITAPGVPDFYQGTELWDLTLVDPDNRRPVDFGLRQKFLADIIEKAGTDLPGLISELCNTHEDGRIKLFLIYMALRARKENSILFREGAYVPINTGGKYKDHIIAFARKYDNMIAITVIPRFLALLIKESEYPFGEYVWQDTYVVSPEDGKCKWKNAFTGEEIEGKKILSVSDIFKSFPVALLISV